MGGWGGGGGGGLDKLVLDDRNFEGLSGGGKHSAVGDFYMELQRFKHVTSHSNPMGVENFKPLKRLLLLWPEFSTDLANFWICCSLGQGLSVIKISAPSVLWFGRCDVTKEIHVILYRRSTPEFCSDMKMEGTT